MTGGRPALVLVHGYLGGAGHWRDQVDAFGADFDVVARDLPGFGDRADVPAPDSIAGFADDVLAGVDARGIDRFALVGHSMGGMIAQHIAATATGRVDRLVLYGTGPVGALPGRFEPIAATRERIRAHGPAATARRVVDSWFLHGAAAPANAACAEIAARAGVQAALAGLTAMERWDGRAALDRIAAPTLVIWGDRDRSYDWSQPQALWRGIPGAALAVAPNCAHNVHQENPALFNRLLADFLSTEKSR